MLRWIAILLSISCAFAVKRYMIIAPDVFHVGVPEKVSIAVYDVATPVTVKVYLQDYPSKRKTFSQTQGVFAKDVPGFLTVQVNPADLPDQGSQEKQYVYLIAKCEDPKLAFTKEVKILLSYKDGVILLETDKPIYTPKQSVKIRVMPLGFDLKPSEKRVTVIVKNPQGIRVEQWRDLSSSNGFISKVQNLDEFALLGNWTVEAFYGHGQVHNTSTQFEVREYVLPRFVVKIERHPKFSNYILRKTQRYPFVVTARYTFGKPVEGSVHVALFIVGMKQTPKRIRYMNAVMRDGRTALSFRPSLIKSLGMRNLWFPEGFRLQIEATVIEKATGLKANTIDNSIHFTTSPYRIKYHKTAEYFRPGLPFPVKVVVTYPNGRPAAMVPMRISAKATKRDGTEVDVGLMANMANKDQTDIDGQAEFIVDIPREVATLRVKVETESKEKLIEEQGVKEYTARAYTSQSGDFLMIRQLRQAEVGKNVICEAFLNSKNVDRLTYVVIARGKIVHQDALIREFGIVTTMRFRATAMMSPSARLIGYYISKATGEVVSDSVLLDVKDALPTEVRIHDSDRTPRQFPGIDYEIRVFGQPGTRVGLLAVDQSVYLLKNEHRLTPKSVYEKLEKLDLGCGVGSGRDSKDVFKNAGAVSLSETLVSDGRQDMNALKTFWCEQGRVPGRRRIGCITRLLQQEFARQFSREELHVCRKAFFMCCLAAFGNSDMGLLARNAGGGFDVDFDISDEEILENTQVRSFFPETWIYQEKVIGDDGQISERATIPDSITTWVVQAVAVSNSSGLGIAKPLYLQAYKSFFLHMTLPYATQRGEQIQVLVTVHNYYDRPISVKIFLAGHEKFCSKVKPGAQEIVERFNMKAQSTKTISILVMPKEVGRIPIRVTASAGVESDSEERNLLVVPEGVEKIKTQSFVLDPAGVMRDKKQKGERANAVDVKVFENNRIYDPVKSKQVDDILMRLPKDVIPDSIGAWLSFTGSLIGPVVTNLIKGGLEKILRMPTGCGEQTMLALAPNVYVLEYLTNTNQVTASVEGNAYKFIQAGYVRELNYRRSDKSFSAFGNRRQGSVWLTAFVMKVFCKASRFDGVQIDSNLVCESVAWLVRNQRGDGAFPETLAVIHRDMTGGVYKSDVAMTAFVVTTLLECTCNNMVNTAAIARAITYLETAIPRLNDPYVLSLVTYALALGNSPKRFAANQRLTNMAVYNIQKSSRHWNTGAHALNIETASYALLAQLALNKLKYSGPIVVWLTEQRNSGGGFKSTTDTCVALQALAKYSEQTAGSQLDLRVSLRSEIGGLQKQITINKGNALLQQKVDLFDYLGGRIFIDTIGTGVAQMQAELRYNVPSTKEERCEFGIAVRVTEDGSGNAVVLPQSDAPSDLRRRRKGKKRKGRKGKKRKGRKGKGKKGKGKKGKKNKGRKQKKQKIQQVHSMRINVCTRFKKPGKTGMAIMDVGIFTGFAVDKDSLKELQKKMNTTIAKYEISERSVVFYVDEIRNDRDLCVSFVVKREFEVGATQPVPVKVYDYYEPDDSCTQFYGADKRSSLSMGMCSKKECKCLQDKCTPKDPTSDNQLEDAICKNKLYAIRGEVVLVDEERKFLTYTMKVLEVYYGGHQKVRKGNFIELRKDGTCNQPNMRKGEHYLVVGSGKGGVYKLDSNTYVKQWTKRNKKQLSRIGRDIKGACANK